MKSEAQKDGKTLSETVQIHVRFSEVDSIRMVWHGRYVEYMEDAREAFGHKYGLEYLFLFQNGYYAPMYDMHLAYKQTASVDDILAVKITYRPTAGAKLVFDYEIRRQSDNALICTATTIQLFTTLEGVFEPSCPAFLEEWKRRWGV